MNPIRCAIVGPTGYTGLVLIELLAAHPQAQLTYLASHREELPDIRQEFPRLAGRVAEDVAVCKPIDPAAIASQADVCFLCLPHKAAMAYAPQLLDAGLKVIDLSADYRIQDPSQYEYVYETPHQDVANLTHAVYGLPELFRKDIPGAKLVANPGCYPTAAAVALAPLLEYDLIDPNTININAASGVTGAGRSAKAHTHYPELNESFYAYGKTGGHRHQPEITQTLSTIAGRTVEPLFVPHLLPVDRGILETIYCTPNPGGRYTRETLTEAFENKYKDEPFIRFRQAPPNIKSCTGTNFVDLYWDVVEVYGGLRVVVMAAEDNMVKGASGQAVQNMNILFDLPETTGLL